MRLLSTLKGIRLMPFGNRNITQAQVKHLKQSIIEHGIQRNLQVVYTNVFGEGWHHYILDGQHLYTACDGLNILDTLYCSIDLFNYTNPIEIVARVSEINSDQKGWRLADFIKAYASTNQLLDYNTLDNRYYKYGLSYQLSAMIYGGLSSTTSSQMIKRGTFKIIDLKRGDEICEILQDILSIFGRGNNIFLREFTFAFYHWYNSVNYDHFKFKEFIEEHSTTLSLLKANEMEIILQGYNNQVEV
jgi:hypothetical protein